MKLNGSEDIRIRKTITSIQRTFCEMVCEMDYEKITVKELCRRALINKKTFYVYYETLDCLLKEIQESYSTPYIAEVKNYKLPKDAEQLVRAFFEFSARQDEAYEKITIAASYHGIRSEMINKVMLETIGKGYPYAKAGISDFQSIIQYRFVSETCLMIYEEWIHEQKKTSLEDVIKLAESLIMDGMNGN